MPKLKLKSEYQVYKVVRQSELEAHTSEGWRFVQVVKQVTMQDCIEQELVPQPKDPSRYAPQTISLTKGVPVVDDGYLLVRDGEDPVAALKARVSELEECYEDQILRHVKEVRELTQQYEEAKKRALAEEEERVRQDRRFDRLREECEENLKQAADANKKLEFVRYAIGNLAYEQALATLKKSDS